MPPLNPEHQPPATGPFSRFAVMPTLPFFDASMNARTRTLVEQAQTAIHTYQRCSLDETYQRLIRTYKTQPCSEFMTIVTAATFTMRQYADDNRQTDARGVENVLKAFNAVTTVLEATTRLLLASSVCYNTGYQERMVLRAEKDQANVRVAAAHQSNAEVQSQLLALRNAAAAAEGLANERFEQQAEIIANQSEYIRKINDFNTLLGKKVQDLEEKLEGANADIARLGAIAAPPPAEYYCVSEPELDALNLTPLAGAPSATSRPPPPFSHHEVEEEIDTMAMWSMILEEGK